MTDGTVGTSPTRRDRHRPSAADTGGRRTRPRTRRGAVTRRRTASASAVVLLAATATACDAGPTPSDLARRSNQLMATTSFHASGTTTVVDGGHQEVWYDPAQGMRTAITDSTGTPVGDLFCHGNDSYLSSTLALRSLVKTGQPAAMPTDMGASFVHLRLQAGCTQLFGIPAAAKRQNGPTTWVAGVRTTTLVAATPPARDVYHVSATGRPYLLRMDSDYGGAHASTVYDSFGAPVRVHLPSPDRVVEPDRFRDAALAAGSAPPAATPGNAGRSAAPPSSAGPA